MVLLAVCLAPWPPTTAAAKSSTAATVSKIRETWVQDLRAKRIDDILSLYASDAVFLQPSGERVAGAPALRTLFKTVMATFDSDLTLHSQNVEASGNLAFESGDFRETLTTIATGAKITTTGSYLIIYKRQQDGRWLIIQQVFTGTLPHD